VRETAFFKATAASAFALSLALAPAAIAADDAASKAASAAESMADAAADAAAAAESMTQAAEEMAGDAEATGNTAENAADEMAGDTAESAAEQPAMAQTAQAEEAVEEAQEAAEESGEAVPDYEQNISLDFVVQTSDGTEYAGDPEAGSRIFRRCMQCHLVEPGAHRQGPSLYGLLGREAGTVEGYNRYSRANRESGITWTKQALFDYLENPRRYIRGTSMAFAGLRDPQDRADVIAYIIEQTLEN